MAEELRFGENRYEIRAPRLYRNDEIEVSWQPVFCNHFRACVFGLPRVFRPQERPWIDVDAASADQLAEVIVRCPTGALHFRRLDGGPQEEARDTPAVHVEPKGPLYVRGWVEVEDESGEVIRKDSRMALCRCGASLNKPFCDGSHVAVYQAEASGSR